MRELEKSSPADSAACVDGVANCYVVDAEVRAKRNLVFE